MLLARAKFSQTGPGDNFRGEIEFKQTAGGATTPLMYFTSKKGTRASETRRGAFQRGGGQNLGKQARGGPTAWGEANDIGGG